MQEKRGNRNGRYEPPLRQEISTKEAAATEAAHQQAEKDMDDDVELTAHSPNDDLDEGETARLGEETDLI